MSENYFLSRYINLYVHKEARDFNENVYLCFLVGTLSCVDFALGTLLVSVSALARAMNPEGDRHLDRRYLKNLCD